MAKRRKRSSNVDVDSDHERSDNDGGSAQDDSSNDEIGSDGSDGGEADQSDDDDDDCEDVIGLGLDVSSASSLNVDEDDLAQQFEEFWGEPFHDDGSDDGTGFDDGNADVVGSCLPSSASSSSGVHVSGTCHDTHTTHSAASRDDVPEHPHPHGEADAVCVIPGVLCI